MAKHRVEFFWDAVSPYTYLANELVLRMRDQWNAEVIWRPFFLGAVMKDTGNRPPAQVPAKGKYLLKDLQDHMQLYDLPFQFPWEFPAMTLTAMRAAVWCDQQGKGQQIATALLRAYWAEGKSITDTTVIAQIVDSIGLDGPAAIAATQDNAIKEALKVSSAEAVERGAFGAPTFYVDGEDMYWGHDRLSFVDAKARRA